jgi:nucleoside-diphosphate-sugar epimerase
MGNIILVTGATGFVGSVLCKKLLERGYKVWGIGRKKYGFLTEEVVKNPNFSFVRCDLAQEVPKIDVSFDAIFHLASILPQKIKNTSEFYLTEIAFFSFLETINADFICYASTCSVYGISKGPISEGTPVFIKSHYANAKLLGENLISLSSYRKKVIVRFPIIVGKSDTISIVNTFYHFAKSSKPIEVFSKGERLRNIIHVEDAVEIMIRAYEKRDSLDDYELFVAGSRDSMKMKEIAELIKKLLNSDSDIILSEKTPPTDCDVIIDISKIIKKLDFIPMSTKEAVERYIKEMEGML